MEFIDALKDETDSGVNNVARILLGCIIITCLGLQANALFEHYIFVNTNTSLFSCFYFPFKHRLVVDVLSLVGVLISIFIANKSDFGKLNKVDLVLLSFPFLILVINQFFINYAFNFIG